MVEFLNASLSYIFNILVELPWNLIMAKFPESQVRAYQFPLLNILHPTNLNKDSYLL